MIFVEDSKSFELRTIEEHQRQRDEFHRDRPAQVLPEKQHVLDIIKEAGEPIKIVAVANQFSREVAHYWDSRASKADLRLRAFRLVGTCVKEFLIERHKRQWVVYLGPNNPRRQAWLQKIEETMRNFPKPNI